VVCCQENEKICGSFPILAEVCLYKNDIITITTLITAQIYPVPSLKPMAFPHNRHHYLQIASKFISVYFF
jgi:hypothetical protein